MEIQIAGGATLVVPCRDPAGNEGATLQAPAGNSSAWTLTAFDSSSPTPLATASGTALTSARAPTPVAVDLPLATGPAASALDVQWSFMGQRCAPAAVASVQLQLADPNAPALSVNAMPACDTNGLDGTTLPGPYPAGQFPIVLTGDGGAGAYSGSGNISANGLSASTLLADLQRPNGSGSGVTVHFSFAGQGCAVAGIDTISVQLSRANGTALAPPASLSCADGGQSYLFNGTPGPGTAFLWVEGSSQGVVQSLANPQVLLPQSGYANYTVSAQVAP